MRKKETTETISQSVESGSEKVKKNNKRFVCKKIDLSKYRIYTVTQQIFIGDYYYEGQINLYSKDEDIQFQVNNCYNGFKKIKGHIAVPKGVHIKKKYNSTLEYNNFIKENKKILKI